MSSHDSECASSGSGCIMEQSSIEAGGPEPRWQAVGSWTDEQEASLTQVKLCEQLLTLLMDLPDKISLYAP